MINTGSPNTTIHSTKFWWNMLNINQPSSQVPLSSSQNPGNEVEEKYLSQFVSEMFVRRWKHHWRRISDLVRKLQFQESRITLQLLPNVWLQPDGWTRVCGVQSAKTGHNIIVSHYPLSAKNNLWPSWRALCASEALLISMSLFRHDSSFCKTSSWNKHD